MDDPCERRITHFGVTATSVHRLSHSRGAGIKSSRERLRRRAPCSSRGRSARALSPATVTSSRHHHGHSQQQQP
jgi:hypothetical protein